MRVIPQRKSQTQKTVDTIVAWLKLGAVAGAAKGAGKGAAKRVLPIAAAGTIAFVALKKLRGGREEPQSFGASANGSPTPAAPPEPATRQ